MSFELKSAVRRIGEPSNLATVEPKELIEFIGADELRLVRRNTGEVYLHMANSVNKEYFTIKLGKKVGVLDEGREIPQLIRDYKIYVSKTFAQQAEEELALKEKREPNLAGFMPVFTFGPVGVPTEPVATMKVADLMKQLKGQKITEKAG